MSNCAFALAAALTAALAAPASAQQNADWTRPFPAFKLIGNVYWVGTYDLSTYLITSGDGHILINTGFPETVPQIRQGVEKLGFKFGDVKVLLATHAHGDHVAGLAELKRLTGARVMMTEPDAALLEDGGRSDFRFGDEPGTRFPPVAVDRRLGGGPPGMLGSRGATRGRERRGGARASGALRRRAGARLLAPQARRHRERRLLVLPGRCDAAARRARQGMADAGSAVPRQGVSGKQQAVRARSRTKNPICRSWFDRLTTNGMF